MENEMKETTTQVEMTAAEKAEFEEFKAMQAKKAAEAKRKADRDAYAELVDEQIEEAIPELMALSQEIKTVKETIYGNFRQVLDMKKSITGATGNQYTHTFTNSRSDMRIFLGVNTVDGYRDTVEDGISMVKEYIESLAKDDESRALVNAVMRLMSRDQRGTLKASRVLQLERMADESGNEQFQEGVRIIKEAYQPTVSSAFVRAEFKNERGQWIGIPLSITEV